VAEQSGLIVSLGAWALRTALNTLLILDQAGHDQIQMGVNVSAVQMSQPEFLSELDEALRFKGVDPARLELEITESVALIGMDRVTALLDAIRARHIGIAIDDFGTGFSSLSYLDQLPADRIKIDRSFVEHLENNRRGARIARMIVPLGHQLGMKVVAEGVETQQQLDLLRELGCDEAQGFLFARPLTLDELMPWLDRQSPSRCADAGPR
jgi:diguanylate cyclase